MNILILEDEPRAANQLQNLLVQCNFKYHLLAILDSIEEALIWFQGNDPADLVFMDIQLADGLSFELFQKTKIESPIIFTTAFDQYAIQAFKVNSIDYLLKPIQEDELNAALNKFLKSKKTAVPDPIILKQVLRSLQAPSRREGILVKEGNSFLQISVTDLLYFYSEDSITFGVSSKKRFIIDESIDYLYNTLDPKQFYKINRAQIVARKSINKIEPYFNHRVKLSISNPRDQEFIVSRTKTSFFKEWLNS